MTFGIGYGRSQKLAFFIVFAAAISCIFLLISSGSKAADYAIQFGPSSDVMTSEFQITLRDSVTGARAAGRIVTTSGDGTVISESTNSTGHGRFSVAPGRQEIEISSPGYTSLTTHFELNQPELKVTAWLDPVETPSEMRSEAISSKIVADKILLHGHVKVLGRANPGLNGFLHGQQQACNEDYFNHQNPYQKRPPSSKTPTRRSRRLIPGP